jgi:Ca-activated chloride channel homolog
MSLRLTITPDLVALSPRDEPQLCYALISVVADAGGAARPVNWALVADASRSMRIPIVSEAQFRELVRAGGAQEVLVDGVPVWQLTAPVPDTIRADAPSALDHTARALHSVVERLDRADRFSLIATAEQSSLLVPSTSGADRAALVAGIGKLKGVHLGEETDLHRGMEMALRELVRGRHHTNEPVERIILLTDGFTREAEACVALTRQVAAQGISVSTIGVGGEFQDELLTQLADISGGRAVFVNRAEAIPDAVEAELDAARGVAVRALSLRLNLPLGVEVRRATRLSPSLAPLELQPDGERALRLHLGDLDRTAPVRLLLELLAPPTPRRMPIGGTARVRLAAVIATSGSLSEQADLVALYTSEATAPPAPVLDAAARANAARLQRRGLAAAAAGDLAAAVAMLRAAAERLATLGEAELAAAAMREAQSIAETGRTTGVGAKELTYATRRL